MAKIGYWNVWTMSEILILSQTVNEMKNYKLSILGLSETCWPKSGEFTSEKKSILFPGRNDNIHCQAVAFILDRDAKNILLE